MLQSDGCDHDLYLETIFYGIWTSDFIRIFGMNFPFDFFDL